MEVKIRIAWLRKNQSRSHYALLVATGLSVSDSEMLIAISEILEIPVGKLLGENIELSKADQLEAISQKLEVINLQLSQKKERS